MSSNDLVGTDYRSRGILERRSLDSRELGGEPTTLLLGSYFTYVPVRSLNYAAMWSYQKTMSRLCARAIR